MPRILCHAIALRERLLFRKVPAAMRRNAAMRQADYAAAVEGRPFSDGTRPRAHATRPGTPPVSVITRTMAGREYLLREALVSVLRQECPPREMFVVQDGKNDSAADAVRETVEAVRPAFERRGCSLRLLTPGSVGRCLAGNAGLAEASGEYCLFLDDDDLLFPGHIAVLAAALTERPDAVAAYARSLEVQTKFAFAVPADGASAPRRPQVTGYEERRFRIHSVPDAGGFRDTIALRNVLPIQAALFRRNAFTECGGFAPDLEALEDWNLWFRYSLLGEFIALPDVTSLFRTPAGYAERMRRKQAMDAFRSAAVARNEEDAKTFGRPPKQ